MKSNFFLLFIIMISVNSCSKKDQLSIDNKVVSPASDKVYIIKKGNHFSEGNKFEFFKDSIINCKVVFDSSAIYESVLESNQGDVNKLIGFSDCGTAHHENSSRLGWSWNGKSVSIYAYVYNDSIRTIKEITQTPINREVTCSLSVSGDQYYFSVNGIQDSIPAHCKNFKGDRYKLYPYFGGDETAPHDIRIVFLAE